MTQKHLIILILVSLCATGCTWFDNQTTYFNTYYNIRRITIEVEDEFAFQDENKRTKPRLFVPVITGVDSLEKGPPKSANYQFLKAFVIEKSKLQPVGTKVDSILIKGSKILATRSRTDYVEGSLFHMAKAYFFKSEYLPSQQKCLEQVEKFPEGEYSPDSYLLLAKDYLLQRKVSQGRTALSKCIDVAWYRDRYDILSEAYRIQAEMALEDGELDKAIQPYKQAIAQTDDAEVQARWQVEVGGLNYRVGNYHRAIEAFEDVFDYSPDALTEFEAKLYKAASLVQLDSLQAAEDIFADMESDRKFEEWKSFIDAERMALERKRKKDLNSPAIIAAERKADTAYVGRHEVLAQSYQKGMELYKKGDYEGALAYFAKAKVIRTAVYEVANKYYTRLKAYDDAKRRIGQFQAVVSANPEKRDSMARLISRERYAIGRVHEQFSNVDSAMQYYEQAHDFAPVDDPERPRYLFSQSRLMRSVDPDVADSLADLVTQWYPTSDVSKQASTELGYGDGSNANDAERLFQAATAYRKVKDWSYASSTYADAAARFPDDAPKALYMAGWMFEREVGDLDSAMHYYGILVETYPRSEYAKEIRPSLEYALAKINNVEVNDSLLLRDLDGELLQRAKAGERGLLDQMIDNNRDALQIRGPDLNLPNIPGVTPDSSSGGTNLNNMLQRQIQGMTPPRGGQQVPRPNGTATPVPVPPPAVPDTTTRKP
jgi:tetratricopeptide (TPR) repeat protein